MIDNLRLLRIFVVGMGIILFLGFFILMFVAFYKASNPDSSCLKSEIPVSGKILDFIPISDSSVGVVTELGSQKLLTIYDYCSGEKKKRILFTESQ